MNEPPTRKFMLQNMTPTSEETREKLTYRRMRHVVKRTLREIGFHLPRPHIKVDSFGPMPEGESHIWATFEVDPHTALSMRVQRKGRRAQIERINVVRAVPKANWLKLKQFKGNEYEAVRMTVHKAAKLLSRASYPKNDGFTVEIVKDTIQVKSETISVEKLIREYQEVFEKAVKDLPDTHRDIMHHLQTNITRPAAIPADQTRSATIICSPEEAARRPAHYPQTPPTVYGYRPTPAPSPLVSDFITY